MSKRKNFQLSILAAATTLALTTTLAAPAFAGRKAHTANLRPDETYGQFIIKYRAGSAPATSQASLASALDKAQIAANGKAIGVKYFRTMAIGAKVVRADRKLDQNEAADLMRQIAADPNVEWVQPDRMVRALAVPNDPDFVKQWHYADNAVGIKAPTAWNTSSGEGIVVGVVDSGILAHTDLDANILPGYDFITSTVGFTDAECRGAGASPGCGKSDDGDGRDDDPNDVSNIKHGTHVAGTIAAVTNNGSGGAGVAYGAKVVPARALGNQGFGSTSDITDAIIWVSGGHIDGVPDNENPAEVINLSVGGGGKCSDEPAYQDAIDAANANGSIVVVAAGNSNADVAEFVPASCAGTITVAASNKAGKRASYSNYGATIDVTAPGGENGLFAPSATEGVISTMANNTYGPMAGTSMASPHVAGIVALVQSAATAAGAPKTADEMLALLQDTARPISAANCTGGCGAGLVDAAAAVAAVGGGNPPANQAPVANFTSTVNGLTASFTDTSTDSDGNIASRAWTFGDGGSSTQANPSRTYAAAGTYSVKLTVTDDDGATHSVTKSVTVSSPTANKPPVANFTSSTSGLTATFTDTSTDPDGSIASRTWNFGDNTSSTLANPSHTYAAAGTYTVTLTAKDNNGATNSKSASVTVTAPTNTVQTYTNTTDVAIADNTTVTSTITVSGRTGNAPINAVVSVNILHTYRGDLKVELVAPDGSAYVLKNYNIWDSVDNVIGSATLNLSTETLNGAWKLRVSDNSVNDIGKIDSWSIKF